MGHGSTRWRTNHGIAGRRISAGGQQACDVHQRRHAGLLHRLSRSGRDPRQGRPVVRVLHRRAVRRGRRAELAIQDRRVRQPGPVGGRRVGLRREQPAELGGPDDRLLGARHPLPQRPVLALLHRAQHHDQQPGFRPGHRRGHRTDAGRSLDALGRAGHPGQAAGQRVRHRDRPGDVHRRRRYALPLLRRLRHRDLGGTPLCGRPARGVGAGPRGRLPLRGSERPQARRLLLPLRVVGQLLRRTHHRLQRLRRTLDQPARPVRRPARHTDARQPLRRDAGHRTERQRLDRYRSPFGGARPQRSVVHGLPRDRPQRPLARRPTRLHDAADEHRPARLDRRLADRTRRTGSVGDTAPRARGTRRGRRPVRRPGLAHLRRRAGHACRRRSRRPLRLRTLRAPVRRLGARVDPTPASRRPRRGRHSYDTIGERPGRAGRTSRQPRQRGTRDRRRRAARATPRGAWWSGRERCDSGRVRHDRLARARPRSTWKDRDRRSDRRQAERSVGSSFAHASSEA